MNAIRAHSQRVLMLLVLLAGTTSGTARGGYDVTDLGTLGGNDAEADGINSLNQVVGTSRLGNSSSSPEHAYIYDPATGVMNDLGSFPNGNFSKAVAINNSGVAVGYGSTDSNGDQQGFQGTTSINPISLPAPYSANDARGINDSGTIVGTANVSHLPDASTNAPYVLEGSKLTILPSLGGTGGTATGINASGLVVGSSAISDGNGHAYVSNADHTQVFDLGTLGGYGSGATAINASGEVVGISQITTSSPFNHAFLYQNGVMTNIGLPGYFASSANGLNDGGVVVGETDFAGSQSITHGFLYTNGNLYDLNLLISPSLGLVITDATGINNNGFISAYGIDYFGNFHALLLSPTPLPPLSSVTPGDFQYITLKNPNPTPEPSSFALLAVGFVMASFVGWRRRGIEGGQKAEGD